MDTGTSQATPSTPPAAPGPRRMVGHWPVLVGVATCALIATDLAEGVELAKVLAGSAAVYLGAAAAGSRRAAWPMFALMTLVIIGCDLVSPGFEAAWAVLGLAVLFAGYAVVRAERHRRRPSRPLALQGAGMLGFAVVTIAALYASTTVGSVLVALGLLAHAGWDVYHYRARQVVATSLAEFCMVLDTGLAVVILALVAA